VGSGQRAPPARAWLGARARLVGNRRGLIDRAGDLFDKGREYFEEQAQRLTSAFEAGRSAMKDEITRGRSSN